MAGRMTDDEQVGEVLRILKATRLTVHVRGTDRNPVVEVKVRGTGQVVGGTELRRRIESAREAGRL